jgi:hypothetical protein
LKPLKYYLACAISIAWMFPAVIFAAVFLLVTSPVWLLGWAMNYLVINEELRKS